MFRKKKMIQMTIHDLYRLGVKELTDRGIEDPSFDARFLLESLLDVDASSFFIKRNDPADSTLCADYLELLSRRCKHEPLQYIVGKWEFYSNKFCVGSGVLIPRPETELLIDEAKIFLSDRSNPVVVDFCSGSGCIAVTVAKLFPEATVYAVEKYDQAYGYLLKNIELNCVDNVIPVKGDIFDKNVLGDIKTDLILSNPPYIRSQEIDCLQIEVRSEPHTALDGGTDGFDFYRILCDYWFTDYLTSGSAMMLECGEDQGDILNRMFSDVASDVQIINDYNDLQRIVVAYK